MHYGPVSEAPGPSSSCVQFKRMKGSRGKITTSSREMLKLQSKSLFWKILNENTTTKGPKVAKNSQPPLPEKKKKAQFRQYKLYVLV